MREKICPFFQLKGPDIGLVLSQSSTLSSFRCAPPAENQTAAPASKMRDLAYAFTTVNKLAWMQEVITLKASVMWIVGDDPAASSILASTCLTVSEAGNCSLPSWPR